MNNRVLQAAVVGMGVLIVAGVIVLGATIARRIAGPAAPAMPAGPALTLLDEPAGTHVVQVTATADRLAVLLQGGGADRVLLLDPATGQIVGRIALAR